MFDFFRCAFFYNGIIKRKVYGEIGIFMHYVQKNILNADGNVKLLFAFADESLLFCLAALDLSAHKFPKQAAHLVFGALAYHKFAVFPYKGGNDLGYFYII